MRPRGEIRQAIAEAAVTLARERGGGTWKDLAHRACVGLAVAQDTVKNMVRAGELEQSGTVRVEGARRPMSRLVPRGSWVRGEESLDNVLRGWVRG